jgi:hypothetical protein
MSILWLCIGILIGLFIPGPFNLVIRGWVVSLWNKIFKKTDPKDIKFGGDCHGLRHTKF